MVLNGPSEIRFRNEFFPGDPVSPPFGDQRESRPYGTVLEMREFVCQNKPLRQCAGGGSDNDERPTADPRSEAVDFFERVFFDLRSAFTGETNDVDSVFHQKLLEAVFLLYVLNDRFCFSLRFRTVSDE